MRLLSSPTSPYGRKVKLAAGIKGLTDRIAVEVVDTAVPLNAELKAQNPLIKIPVLVLADGTQIYDSHVICEYLDTLAPSRVLFPPSGPARFKTLTLGALCDGILDAALMIVYEKRMRPEDKWVQSWVDRQQAKVDSGVEYLARNTPALGAAPDYGHLTMAAMLGYLDLRQGGAWRAKHPSLVGWLDRFSAMVPAFEATRVKS